MLKQTRAHRVPQDLPRGDDTAITDRLLDDGRRVWRFASAAYGFAMLKSLGMIGGLLVPGDLTLGLDSLAITHRCSAVCGGASHEKDSSASPAFELISASLRLDVRSVAKPSYFVAIDMERNEVSPERIASQKKETYR